MPDWKWIICLLLLSACGGQGAGGQTGGDCDPGALISCPCADDEKGLRMCQANGTWSKCTCSPGREGREDTVVSPDVEPETVTPVLPPQGGKPGASEMAGGAVGLTSENYRLNIVVGATRPVGEVASEQYRLRLGPVEGEE